MSRSSWNSNLLNCDDETITGWRTSNLSSFEIIYYVSIQNTLTGCQREFSCDIALSSYLHKYLWHDTLTDRRNGIVPSHAQLVFAGTMMIITPKKLSIALTLIYFYYAARSYLGQSVVGWVDYRWHTPSLQQRGIWVSQFSQYLVTILSDRNPTYWPSMQLKPTRVQPSISPICLCSSAAI